VPPFGRDHPTTHFWRNFCGIELRDVGVGGSRDHVPVPYRDEGQVAVEIPRVEAVAEHELVPELQPAVSQLVRHDPARRTVEQRAGRQPAWPSARELAHQICERQPGVDHVLDHDHVAAGDVGAEVVQDLHAPRVGSEPRDRHEVDLDGYPFDGSCEISDEEQRALQHDADEHDSVGMICRDLGAQPPNLRGDRVGIQQDGGRHVIR